MFCLVLWIKGGCGASSKITCTLVTTDFPQRNESLKFYYHIVLTQLKLSLGLDGRKLTLPLKSVWIGAHWLRKPGQKFENQLIIPWIFNSEVLKE